MAHFGIAGPRSFLLPCDQRGNSRIQMPPRKHRLISINAVNMGTDGEIWRNFDGMSSECELWSDDETYFYYKWINPDDTSSVIDLHFRYELNPATSHTTHRYWYNGLWRAFKASELLATWPYSYFFSEAVKTFAPHTRIGPGWNNEVPLPRWLSVPMAFEYGSWEDQPEFHPYRQNPFA